MQTEVTFVLLLLVCLGIYNLLLNRVQFAIRLPVDEVFKFMHTITNKHCISFCLSLTLKIVVAANKCV